MATGKALNGKPYAGNPHVRFDEGEVASAAMPRRGSLLYIRTAIVAICVAAQTALVAEDKTWAAPNGTGNWGDSYWMSGSGTLGAFDSRKCAYFTLPVNTIDLNGQSRAVWSFRSGTGMFSNSDRCVINIVNNGSTDSTLEYVTFRSDGPDDIRNAVVTFGGSGSAKKVKVYHSQDNRNDYTMTLKYDSHLVFGANSEYTEYTGDVVDTIGAGATSNSLTVASGASVTIKSMLNVGGASGATGVLTIDGGTMEVQKRLKVGAVSGSTGIMIVNGGMLTVNEFFCIGQGGAASLTINGGVVKNTLYDMPIGDASAGTVTIRAGGRYVNETPDYGLRVGCGAAGTLNVQGGEVELPNVGLTLCANSGKNVAGTVNVTDGGSITAKSISHGAGNGNAALTVNNGTIRATSDNEGFIPAHTKLTVTAGAGGAIFDTNGKRISIAKGITGSGAVKLVGGGTVTFSAAPAGKIYIAYGTTLAVPTKSIADAILSHGLELVGISAPGTYTVLTCDEDLTGADTALVTCWAADGCVPAVDGNSIVVTVAAMKSGYWTGAAGDGNLSTPGNWSDNTVPTSGNAEIWCVTNETLAKGATFAPSSITFAANSAKVTIDGGALAGITAITNHSAISHVFNCAVSGDTIDFMNDAMRCAFRGGITVKTPVFDHSPITPYDARELVGNWTITGATWTPVTCNSVGRGDSIGSSVTVLGELFNPNNMNIEPGSVVTAATMRVTTSQYPAYDNQGRLVVTGMVDIANTASDFSIVRDETQTATVIFGGMVFNTTKWPWLNAKNLVVGEAGFNFSSKGRMYLRFSNGVTLHPRDNTLTFGAAVNGLDQIYTINRNTILTVCTTRFETHEPATVNINGIISDVVNYYDGGMAVTGNGTVVFNSVSSFTGGLDIGDTATVQVNAGCTPGSGVVSVGANATFEVAESGTVALGGGLTLADGAALGFNFTEKAVPVLDATGKAVTLGANGTVVVKVSAAEGTRAKGGAHELTAGGAFTGANVSLAEGYPDWVKGVYVNAAGNIVLDAKSTGMMVIVK